MPDVPERCPHCGADTLPKEAIAPHLDGAWECGTCLTFELVQSNLCAARAEAERWKRRHDALRAAVIKADALIVDAIQRATAMYNHTQDDDYASRSDGLDEALMILRQLLTEAGGGEDA